MKPSTRRVLEFLRDAGDRGVTTAELCQKFEGGGRFGARIGELKEAGYTIEKQRISRTSTRYWLRGEPAAADPAPAPAEPAAYDQGMPPVPLFGTEGAHIPGISACGCDACLQGAAGDAPADHELARMIAPATAAGREAAGIAA